MRRSSGSLRRRLGPFVSSGNYWIDLQMHRPLIHNAVEVFMVIKDFIVLKKLAGEYEQVDLIEIKSKLDPRNMTDPARWHYERKDIFDFLVDQKLVKHIDIRVGRYGYGDDQGYILTGLARKLIIEHKGNDALEQALTMVLYGVYKDYAKGEIREYIDLMGE